MMRHGFPRSTKRSKVAVVKQGKSAQVGDQLQPQRQFGPRIGTGVPGSGRLSRIGPLGGLQSDPAPVVGA